MSVVRLSVPGNLLLFGEYAVLEEGGIGLAMALDVRVRLEATTDGPFSARGIWPGHEGTTPLLDAVAQVLRDAAGIDPTGTFQVNSSAFFSPDGRKSGLGSSAAVTVALVCGMLAAAGRHEEAHGPVACSLALQAHRKVQGGRGSGYDVLASFNGGLGLVLGGETPSWDPCSLPDLSEVQLFPGPRPVSTASAIGLYEDWKKRNRAAARIFVADSNAAIGSFIRSRSPEDAMKWLAASRKLGAELGRSIGVPAEIEVPEGLDPRWCKAAGAGNELGLCLRPPEGTSRYARAETGVVWGE